MTENPIAEPSTEWWSNTMESARAARAKFVVAIWQHGAWGAVFCQQRETADSVASRALQSRDMHAGMVTLRPVLEVATPKPVELDSDDVRRAEQLFKQFEDLTEAMTFWAESHGLYNRPKPKVTFGDGNLPKAPMIGDVYVITTPPISGSNPVYVCLAKGCWFLCEPEGSGADDAEETA